ncbi:uncharacterized protein MEPE_04162 [Melanopsichium pennsylvanicum]|uniref:Uncharacterized protein n=2 Tax=Melanopsichium pennsylvanicum TaxID=63383 RepID=A0AAJ5C6E4_9BASI|nr:hypothetical protein BN887_05158 [Melanopsichium pennsylvanicum 4]SNX85453.1 uncharacterized protein MEPE_04162 [Melanopsichium pennsylvanicum]
MLGLIRWASCRPMLVLALVCLLECAAISAANDQARNPYAQTQLHLGDRKLFDTQTSKPKSVRLASANHANAVTVARGMADVFHERGYASFDHAAVHAARQKDMDGAKNLLERGMPFVGSSSDPKQGRKKHSLNGGRGMRIPPYVQETRGEEAGREQTALRERTKHEALKNVGSLDIMERGNNYFLETTLNNRGPAGIRPYTDLHLLLPRGLRKRMDQPTDTIDYYRHHFTLDWRTQPTPEHMRADTWRDVIHFDGKPVFYAKERPVEKAHQAVKDYGSFYIIGERSAGRRAPVPVYLRDAYAAEEAHDSEALLLQMRNAKKLAERQGELAMKLAYGPHFADRATYFAHYWEPSFRDVSHRATTISASTDIGEARRLLNSENMLKLENQEKNPTIGFLLRQDGKVDFEEYPRAAPRTGKRTGSLRMPEYGSSSRQSSSAEAQPAGERHQRTSSDILEDLLQQTGPNWRPSQMEFYGSGMFSDNPSLSPKEGDERGRYYANVPYHKGLPIFFPADDTSTLEKANQAARDYGAFWLIGPTSSQPPETISYLYNKGGKIDPGSNEVFQHVLDMRQAEIVHGPVTKALMFGPDFDRRQPRHGRILGSLRKSPWKTPRWDEVARDAERIQIDAFDHNTPIDHNMLVDHYKQQLPEIWSKLNQKGMLVVVEGSRETGYALKASGKLLYKVLKT